MSGQIGLIWAVLPETAEKKLKYAFQGQKKVLFLFKYFSIRTKKLHNIKLGKISKNS